MCILGVKPLLFIYMSFSHSCLIKKKKKHKAGVQVFPVQVLYCNKMYIIKLSLKAFCHLFCNVNSFTCTYVCMSVCVFKHFYVFMKCDVPNKC